MPLARPAGVEDAKLLEFEYQRRDQRLYWTAVTFARQMPWRRRAKAMTAGRSLIVRTMCATYRIGERAKRMCPPNFTRDALFCDLGTRLDSQSNLRETITTNKS